MLQQKGLGPNLCSMITTRHLWLRRMMVSAGCVMLHSQRTRKRMSRLRPNLHRRPMSRTRWKSCGRSYVDMSYQRVMQEKQNLRLSCRRKRKRLMSFGHLHLRNNNKKKRKMSSLKISWSWLNPIENDRKISLLRSSSASRMAMKQHM